MRRKQRQTEVEQARELLIRAPEHYLSAATPDGEPVLRCLNGIVVDDMILFHGAIAGEKSDCLKQHAVVAAHETVVDISSYFVDGQKACPATTYYRSAMAKGTLFNVESTDLKARMLQALMEKLQPEGGHVPLSADEPLYKKDFKSVRVFGLKIEQLTGKASLGQDKKPEFVRSIVKNLWKRGKPGDLQAIEEILELSPDARPETWLMTTDKGAVAFRVFPKAADMRRHAELVAPEYWRKNVSFDAILRSVESSAFWIGAFDEEGRLIGASRGISDRTWVGWLQDVVTDEEYRGLGIGKRLIEITLEHPMMRECHYQRLGTMDAQEFYRSFGFVESEKLPMGFPVTVMARQGVTSSSLGS